MMSMRSGVGTGAKELVRYGGFNRRMVAATLDSLLVMVFIAPLIDMLLNALYGPVPVDVPQLMLQLGSESDPQKLKALFDEKIIQSGLLQRWFANTSWQTVLLMLATGICWVFWSSTPGKLALGLVIVDANTYKPVTLRQVFLRLAGYVLSSLALFMGFFWIGVDKRRRGWHDYIAGTVVIRKGSAK